MGTYLSSQQVESCPFCGGKTMKGDTEMKKKVTREEVLEF